MVVSTLRLTNFRELVPARSLSVGLDFPMELAQKSSLTPHPNIVEMIVAFADRVPDLRGAMALFPDALPPRYIRVRYIT
jgi:hypothetical protein